MKFFENKFFLPNNLYGVTLDAEKANIERIEMIHLIYHVAGYQDVSQNICTFLHIFEFYLLKCFNFV